MGNPKIIDGNTISDSDPLQVAILSGGTGGGAVTVADGADVAQGTTTDAATANTVIGRLKKLISLLPTALGSAISANSLPVVIASDQGAVAVTPAGNVASGAADSGNPQKVGGVYNSTLPTFTTGQRADLQLTSRGHLVGSVVTTAAGADAASNTVGVMIGLSGTGSSVMVNQNAFNGATWDRLRGNVDQTVGITASGVTTTQTGADQTNYNGRGLIVVLDMTSVGTGSVTLEIDGKDLSSGKYYALLTGAAVTTNSTNVYILYPGVAAVANAAVSMGLPRTWRVKVTANNANAATYTVSASVML